MAMRVLMLVLGTHPPTAMLSPNLCVRAGPILCVGSVAEVLSVPCGEDWTIGNSYLSCQTPGLLSRGDGRYGAVTPPRVTIGGRGQLWHRSLHGKAGNCFHVWGWPDFLIGIRAIQNSAPLSLAI